MPATAATGAVNVTLASPFESVLMLRCDNCPTSTMTSDGVTVSTRSSTSRCGWPFASLAITRIVDFSEPLAVIKSGVAVTASDSDSSDGPVSDGVGVFDTVHDATVNAAITIVDSVILRIICRFPCGFEVKRLSLLRVGKVGKVHADV